MRKALWLAAALAAAVPARGLDNPLKDAETRVAEARRRFIKERGGAPEDEAYRRAAAAYRRAEERYQSLKGGVPFDPELYAVTALPREPDGAAAPSRPAAGAERSEVDLRALAAPVGPTEEESTDLDPRAGAGTLEAASSSADRHAFEARRALEEGRLDAALSAALAAVAADPAFPEGRLLLSKVRARQGLWQEARSQAQEAVRLNERDGASQRALAWSQLNAGAAGEAAATLGAALALNPRDAEAFALRAFASESTGRADAAVSDLRRAAAFDPGRYAVLLARAEAGTRLFTLGDKEAWRLLAGEPPRRAPASVPFGVPAAGAAGLAALVFLPLWRRLNLQQVEVVPMRRGPRQAVPARDMVAEAERAGLLAGKYQLKTLIGRGGMAMVWEAHDHSLNRAAAVKKIQLPEGPRSGSRRSLALQEAKTLVTLRHPNIVDIYEVIESPAGLYLVFEFLQGKTLQQILAEKKRLPWGRLRELLRPVCAGLEYAHARGFVHRDLKPSNVMVTPDGRVKIMDFGIARALVEGDQALDLVGTSEEEPGKRGMVLARTSNLVGTPGYRPPEAERGVVSTAFDVYSLGAVAFEALVGQLPPRAGPGSVEHAAIRLKELVPDLPPAAAAAILASLEPDLSRRPQSAHYFRSRALDS
ncbi:MAG: serine/threonine protein kinase [Elusimicrobia bacterium]|nr:serine/threonine protein kinase [Elusimicrobiota bacterium]